MKTRILSLGTAVPPYSQSQEDYIRCVGEALHLDDRWMEKFERISRNACIGRRYTAVPDYLEPGLRGPLFGDDFMQSPPGTAERNAVYKKEAPKLAHQAAERALSAWGGKPEAITHVISISCTGMVAPGIEFSLVDSLGLRRDVTRLGINFMGCFGAFRGLATAKAFAQENPQHRVLVVCTELCSLHLQPKVSMMNLIANTLFSDGAAAVVVGQAPDGMWSIEKHSAMALPDSLQEMTWEAGNTGYNMVLTQKVPEHFEGCIKEFVTKLAGDRTHYNWAIHPGGKAIVEGIANACQIPDDALEATWKVLRDYGNMSSATFLFVLDALKKQEPTIGLGFGPGLSIEGVLLTA